jgi:transposase InsO family protein
MGIRDRPTAPRSPWQNGYAERLIGSIRRECLDHVVVFGERHLRHVLLSYMKYYNEMRTHYLWRRMRRYRASWSGPDTFFADRSWADCITNMSGLDLRQAHSEQQRGSLELSQRASIVGTLT